MAQFQPSPESKTPAERAVSSLRYLQWSAQLLEKYVQDKSEPPLFLLECIDQATAQAVMAVSYVRQIPRENPAKRKKSSVVEKMLQTPGTAAGKKRIRRKKP